MNNQNLGQNNSNENFNNAFQNKNSNDFSLFSEGNSNIQQ